MWCVAYCTEQTVLTAYSQKDAPQRMLEILTQQAEGLIIWESNDNKSPIFCHPSVNDLLNTKGDKLTETKFVQLGQTTEQTFNEIFQETQDIDCRCKGSDTPLTIRKKYSNVGGQAFVALEIKQMKKVIK